MSIVQETPQREQAGSDSYNRFEYQVFWIVDHIIKQLSNETSSIIFCEYHDDMSKLSNRDNKDCFEFYQVKTKESDDSQEWTIVDMSKKCKRKDGSYKKSFLGFIFYNFLTFKDECQKCFFVSNMDYDLDIRTWQSIIEDEKSLKTEKPELYNIIKSRIQIEYAEIGNVIFDECFERFIQNTFIFKSNLTLNEYELEVGGAFFELVSEKSIPANVARTILMQIVEKVRKKSKTKIIVPISEKRLIEQKGIDVGEIKNVLNEKINEKSEYKMFLKFLLEIGIEQKEANNLVAVKIGHDIKWLNSEDILYQELVIQIRKKILLCGIQNDKDAIGYIKSEIIKETGVLLNFLDDRLVEVLYYEKKYQKTR